MAKATEIASFLAYLSQQGEESDPLTNLRIQKLLYYVQGWSLALRDRPAFEDRIEAWAHGPVVPSVYHDLKKFDRGFVVGLNGEDESTLSDEDKMFLGELWQTYQAYSASKLWQMTHAEAPWENARNGCPPGERSTNEITQDSLKAYFATLAN